MKDTLLYQDFIPGVLPQDDVHCITNLRLSPYLSDSDDRVKENSLF